LSYVLIHYLENVYGRSNKYLSYQVFTGIQWSWSYDSWIYIYLCTQCMVCLKDAFDSQIWQSVLDATLRNKDCQWIVKSRRYSPVSSTNKSGRHGIAEILFKEALMPITLTLSITQWLIFDDGHNDHSVEWSVSFLFNWTLVQKVIFVFCSVW